MKGTKKRRVSVATATVLMVSLLFTGTWAWTSISQDAYNQASDKSYAGGRLHKDFFLTRDKDSKLRSDASVYVENYMPSNGLPLVTRVMIREYLESGNYAGVNIHKSKAEREAEANGTLRILMSNPEADVTDPQTWTIHKFNENEFDNKIRNYFGIEYGQEGEQKEYMPTFNKVSGDADGIGDLDNGQGIYQSDVAEAQLFSAAMKNAVDENGTIYGKEGNSLIYQAGLIAQNSLNNLNKYSGIVVSDDDWNTMRNPINIRRTQRYTDYIRYTTNGLTDAHKAGFTDQTIPTDSYLFEIMGEDYVAAGTGVTELGSDATLGSYVKAVTTVTDATEMSAADKVTAPYKAINSKTAQEYFVREGKVMCQEATHYAKMTAKGENGGVISMAEWKANKASYDELVQAEEALKAERDALLAKPNKTTQEQGRLNVLIATESTAGSIAAATKKTKEAEKKVEGNFWVYDEDGWAYYATAVPQGGNATSLLTKSLTEGKKLKNLEQWYYAMDLTMQCATLNDVGDATKHTGFYQQGGETPGTDIDMPPTEDAEDLLRLLGAGDEPTLKEKIATCSTNKDETVTIDGVEFFVIDKFKEGTKTKAVLWAKNGVLPAQRPFSVSTQSADWEGSDLKNYMDSSEFLSKYPTVLSLAEEITYYSADSGDRHTGNYKESKGKIFLPSEADIYGTVNNGAIPNMLEYTWSHSSNWENAGIGDYRTSGSNSDTWLRSMFTDDINVAGIPNYQGNIGNIGKCYPCYFDEDVLNVRPMFIAALN